jgi:hypothetical protein
MVLEATSANDHVIRDMLTPDAVRGDSSSLSGSSGCHSPWRPVACGSIAVITACLHVAFSHCTRTTVIGFRAHPIPQWLHLNQLLLQKPYFKIKAPFQGHRGTWVWEGHHSATLRVLLMDPDEFQGR